MNKKYHYFYKITNTINNHFYYGVHNTNNLDDGYMGSGVRLHKAYKKYGIENFKKEILKFFDSAKDAFDYEESVVNETLVCDENCYNLQCGGKGGFIPNIQDFVPHPKGKLVVKYKNTKEYFVIDRLEYNPEIHDTTYTNRKRSDEEKNKIRKTMTPENSKNDRVWVNKDGVVKYLRKNLLDEYIKNGWSLGRTGYKPRKNGQGKEIKIN